MMSISEQNLGAGIGGQVRRRRWSEAQKRQTVAEGHDPGTGDVLPRDHVFQQPDVIRALAMAVSALEGYAR